MAVEIGDGVECLVPVRAQGRAVESENGDKRGAERGQGSHNLCTSLAIRVGGLAGWAARAAGSLPRGNTWDREEYGYQQMLISL